MILALLLANAPLSQAEAEARLAVLDAQASAQEAKLAAEQAPLVTLLATAQRLALRPPALTLAKPGTADDMVRTRALIASLAPEIKRRTLALRRRMVATEAARIQVEQALAAALDKGQGADALAQSPNETARLAALPAPGFPAASRPHGAAYRLPVAGKVVIGMGERAGVGVRARGLTLATAGGAAVSAPAMARIAYAGPFRGYGDIVILDHGHGWTSVLAGLELVTASIGELVGAGAPIGHMGKDNPRLTVELRHNGQPIDVVAMVMQ